MCNIISALPRSIPCLHTMHMQATHIHMICCCLCRSPTGPGSISLLLTMASPHQYSPLLLQPALARFYSRLSSESLPRLPVISINGGKNDFQVCKIRVSGIVTLVQYMLHTPRSYADALMLSTSQMPLLCCYVTHPMTCCVIVWVCWHCAGGFTSDGLERAGVRSGL